MLHKVSSCSGLQCSYIIYYVKVETFNKLSSQIKTESRQSSASDSLMKSSVRFTLPCIQFLMPQRCLCWKCMIVNEKLKQWANGEVEYAQELHVPDSAGQQQIVHDKLSFKTSGLIRSDLSHLLPLEYGSRTLQAQENRTGAETN